MTTESHTVADIGICYDVKKQGTWAQRWGKVSPVPVLISLSYLINLKGCLLFSSFPYKGQKIKLSYQMARKGVLLT